MAKRKTPTSPLQPPRQGVIRIREKRLGGSASGKAEGEEKAFTMIFSRNI